MTKDVWLKIDLLELLDNHTGALYFHEVLVAFPQISLSTLQKKCHELQQEIKNCYLQEEVQLIIDRRKGIELIRETSNLQKIMEHLITKELPYQISQKFIYENVLNTEELCEQFAISHSHMRRKIAVINGFINDYDLHITVSNQIKLFGSEKRRRSLLISMLSLTHRQISTIAWIDNSTFYLKQARKIMDYLQLPVSYHYLETIAIISFVNEQAIKRSRKILFQKEEKVLLQAIQFPKKPYFLLHWEENDWIFLLLSIHSIPFSPAPFSIEESFKRSFRTNALYLNWRILFQTYFSPLQKEQEDLLHYELLREYVTLNLLKVNDTFSNTYTLSILKTLEVSYPRYFQVFSTFWQGYTQCHPLFNLLHAQVNALFICETFVPWNHYLPQVSLFIDTYLMPKLEKWMTFKTASTLSKKYRITFTQNQENADFIITTYHDTHFFKKEKIILVEPTFSANDLTIIEKRLDAFYQ